MTDSAPHLRIGSRTVNVFHIAFIAIIFFTGFTRLWRLDQPEQCYFDEVYFPAAGLAVLYDFDNTYVFYAGRENTHPPLSKLLMAGSQALYGHKDYQGGTNECFSEKDDPEKRFDPKFQFDPVGWRMPGALAGVGAVVFMYMLARTLFRSEIAGLASSFLLAADGLVFAHARIGTPDSLVLFFIIGTLYFLVSNRWALAGVFLGLGAATKWNVAFIVFPVLLYFIWRFYVRWRESQPDRELRPAERVLLGGAALIGLGAATTVPLYVNEGHLSSTMLIAAGAPAALGLFVILGGLLAIASDSALRSKPRAQVSLQAALSLPLFFIALPFAVYMSTYIPMFLQGQGLGHWWYLSDEAYKFHASLTASHGWQSEFWQWPINARPVFFWVEGGTHSKIYNLGNPLVYWMSLPALAFSLWQGVKFIRVRIDEESRIAVWGRLGERQAALIFVFISWLVLWLFWATNPRTLFSYHYIPAFVFALLALGYVVHWLWHESRFDRSRLIAIVFVVAVGVTFVYFYPHLAAVNVPRWLDDQYYWFSSWR